MAINLPDHLLMERIDAMLAGCERILAMPLDQRRTVSPKGTSPEQFGAIQATLLAQFWAEAHRRGLVSKPLFKSPEGTSD